MSAPILSLTMVECRALDAAHKAMLQALETGNKPASVASCQRVAAALSGAMQGTGKRMFGDPKPDRLEELRNLQKFHFDWSLARPHTIGRVS